MYLSTKISDKEANLASRYRSFVGSQKGEWTSRKCLWRDLTYINFYILYLKRRDLLCDIA